VKNGIVELFQGSENPPLCSVSLEKVKRDDTTCFSDFDISLYCAVGLK